MGKKLHRTMIGGQAVIEGVMMRGVDKTALAVRKPDGEIYLETWPSISVRGRFSPFRIPFVRGIFNFVEMLISGYKTLTKSAEIASEEVSAESGTTEQPADTTAAEPVKVKEKEESGISKAAMGGLTVLSLLLGLAIAVLLFVVAPTMLVGKTDRFVHWGMFRTLVEGIIKIIVFIAYLALTSLMKDIQRLYQYHGAEHKTIACYEHGAALTPENARKYTRFHPRCGTSFLLIVMIVSIILYSFLTWKTLWLRIVLKLVLLPLVVGISYEIIKFAGRHDNSVMRFLLAPGLWLQRLTTREPDDSQLEVAIRSIEAVLTTNPEDDKW